MFQETVRQMCLFHLQHQSSSMAASFYVISGMHDTFHMLQNDFVHQLSNFYKLR